EIPDKNIIAEPKGRNTALAMGFGATYIHQVDPMAVIVNFASDHHVSNLGKFDRAIKAAAEIANMGDYLVTIGIKPTFPHTGMGYIKASHLFRRVDSSTAYVVERFIEKPDISTAGRFLSDGGYYWNANLYTWRADSILRAFEHYLPEMMKQLEKIRRSLGTSTERSVIKKVYEEAQEISIDYAISEKAKNLVLIPSTFSWSDIGDWKVAYDVSKKDKEGNVVIFSKGKGDFLSVDTKDCLIHFSDRLVATIGVKDLIIVDTKDALLVAKKDRAQDVKTLVNELIVKKKAKYI
ncbi:MAG: sugar phosphate nucleotidyltransferase, partial [bacterium]|nr:sugar phosphate nucleotidyltransferase [bacterium]